MKVLIVSDSHGLENELQSLADKYHSEMDIMIHCGDSELPLTHEALTYFKVVKGNCDFDPSLPDDLLLETDNINFYVTHGHLYHVKTTMMNICYRGEEVGANIVCFGHSHYAGSEIIRDKLYINPGSIRLPKGSIHKTYCILDIEGRNVSVKLYNEKHAILPELCYNYYL